MKKKRPRRAPASRRFMRWLRGSFSRKPRPLWLVISAHVLALGVALVLYALPHHVIPHSEASLGITSSRGSAAPVQRAAAPGGGMTAEAAMAQTAARSETPRTSAAEQAPGDGARSAASSASAAEPASGVMAANASTAEGASAEAGTAPASVDSTPEPALTEAERYEAATLFNASASEGDSAFFKSSNSSGAATAGGNAQASRTRSSSGTSTEAQAPASSGGSTEAQAPATADASMEAQASASAGGSAEAQASASSSVSTEAQAPASSGGSAEAQAPATGADSANTDTAAAESASAEAVSNEAAEAEAVGDFSKRFQFMFTSGAVDRTDNTYRSKNLNIRTKIAYSNEMQARYYVADIYIADISCLITVFGQDKYGRGYTEWAPRMAKRMGGILTINGDYYGCRNTGIVIRNGTLYRNKKTQDDIAILYWDGHMEMFGPKECDAVKEMERGAYQCWCFGPSLLDENGVALTKFNCSNSIAKKNPRSAIGYYEPGHYCFVAVDGRNDRSHGASIPQLAALMESLGCKQAFNLDGGQTSLLCVGDRLVNEPSDGGRSTSDVIMILDGGIN